MRRSHRPSPLRVVDRVTSHLPRAGHPSGAPRTAGGRPGHQDGERGDVPGWVLVTLMTAGLVLALWAVAAPALTDVFHSAIERVTAFGG